MNCNDIAKFLGCCQDKIKSYPNLCELNGIRNFGPVFFSSIPSIPKQQYLQARHFYDLDISFEVNPQTKQVISSGSITLLDYEVDLLMYVLNQAEISVVSVYTPWNKYTDPVLYRLHFMDSYHGVEQFSLRFRTALEDASIFKTITWV